MTGCSLCYDSTIMMIYLPLLSVVLLHYTSCVCLLLTLVYFGQQEFEQFLKAFWLNFGNQVVANSLLLFFIGLVDRFHIQGPVQVLDLVHAVWVMLTIVLDQNLLLGFVHQFQSLADDPGTLGIFNVGPNLAQDFRGSRPIQIVVLDLKVFSQDHANVIGLLVQIAVFRSFAIGQGQSATGIETIVRRLVPNASLVAIQGETTQIERRTFAVGIGSALTIYIVRKREFIRWAPLLLDPNAIDQSMSPSMYHPSRC
jgi:hypothetical protein